MTEMKHGAAEFALRDQFAVQFAAIALEKAMHGWDHFCPTVCERAARHAYEAADAALAHRAELIARATAEPSQGAQS